MTTVDILDRTHSVIKSGGMIFAARQTGLYRIGAQSDAQNLFRTWLPEDDVPTLAITVDSSAGLMLAGINGGIARSADGGRNWEAVQFRSPPPLVTCLALSSAFEDDGCVLAGTFEDGIFRSTDGGKSWRAHNHGLFDHSIYCLALSPSFAYDGIAYAGTGSGVYGSQSGGRFWQDLVLPAGDEAALSLALSADFALYAGTESQGLLRSCDAGHSWQTLMGTQGAVNAIEAIGESTLVAQVDDTVLRSIDGGATWVELVSQGVDCLALAGETILLAMSDGSIRQLTL